VFWVRFDALMGGRGFKLLSRAATIRTFHPFVLEALPPSRGAVKIIAIGVRRREFGDI